VRQRTSTGCDPHGSRGFLPQSGCVLEAARADRSPVGPQRRARSVRSQYGARRKLALRALQERQSERARRCCVSTARPRARVDATLDATHEARARCSSAARARHGRSPGDRLLCAWAGALSRERRAHPGRPRAARTRVPSNASTAWAGLFCLRLRATARDPQKWMPAREDNFTPTAA